MRTAWIDEDAGLDRQVARDSGQQCVVHPVVRCADSPALEGCGLSAVTGDAPSFRLHPCTKLTVLYILTYIVLTFVGCISGTYLMLSLDSTPTYIQILFALVREGSWVCRRRCSTPTWLCAVRSLVRRGGCTEGRHLTKGVPPPPPGSWQVLGRLAARPPPRQKSTHRFP